MYLNPTIKDARKIEKSDKNFKIIMMVLDYEGFEFLVSQEK